MPKAKLNTYHVTLHEVIGHTVDIEAATFRKAQNTADFAWRKDGPEVFSSFMLGCTSSDKTVMVQQ